MENETYLDLVLSRIGIGAAVAPPSAQDQLVVHLDERAVEQCRWPRRWRGCSRRLLLLLLTGSIIHGGGRLLERPRVAFALGRAVLAAGHRAPDCRRALVTDDDNAARTASAAAAVETGFFANGDSHRRHCRCYHCAWCRRRSVDGLGLLSFLDTYTRTFDRLLNNFSLVLSLYF